MLLNYNIPENSIIPLDIYEYTDKERYLILLLGINILQITKNNYTINNEDHEKFKEEEINKLTHNYELSLKEKEDKIVLLEYSKNDIEYCHHYSLVNPEYYQS